MEVHFGEVHLGGSFWRSILEVHFGGSFWRSILEVHFDKEDKSGRFSVNTKDLTSISFLSSAEDSRDLQEIALGTFEGSSAVAPIKIYTLKHLLRTRNELSFLIQETICNTNKANT